ncbi:MAG: MarR family transcriptional regulator [Alphaproteobacteria bacterium]|nr:MAG: MarR family transcriptional regulator [Alphaproteobacteria bacterium]
MTVSTQKQEKADERADSPPVYEKLGGGAPHSKQSLRLWLKLLSCTTVIENWLRNRLRAEFQTTLPRFDVLAALDRHPEGLRMGELSRYLLVSNGNVTGIVQRLEEEGLIAREQAPNDRRAIRVRLTPKGKSRFAEWAREHEGWLDSLFAELSTEEMAELMDHLRHLQESLARRGIPGKER